MSVLRAQHYRASVVDVGGVGFAIGAYSGCEGVDGIAGFHPVEQVLAAYLQVDGEVAEVADVGGTTDDDLQSANAFLRNFVKQLLLKNLSRLETCEQ